MFCISLYYFAKCCIQLPKTSQQKAQNDRKITRNGQKKAKKKRGGLKKCPVKPENEVKTTPKRHQNDAKTMPNDPEVTPK